MKKTFYITTPIYYPNASLHMGHAFSTTISDIVARYHREKGDEVFFLTGSDENTGKILKVAEERGQTVEEYLNEVTGKFRELFKNLNISYDDFIRTTDKEKHWPGAIKMWNALVESDDIYPSTYEGLYCLSCETFYTEKDLIEGKCPIHGTIPEYIKEKNYFFRLSKYGDVIKQKIESGELEVIPASRKNEIVAFIDRGLEDISFSRPKTAVPHGIPVPGDPEQVIYVWGDALVNYISALGYGREDDVLFKKFWPVDYHVIGKDILRFHALIWPGMLLSAGLPLPKHILVHGLIISGGKKMSKSLGNVIDPNDLINEYGLEALRYFLAHDVSVLEDSDVTLESFKASYNANLANGLGNVVSRIMTMAEKNLSAPVDITDWSSDPEYDTHMNEFNIQAATQAISARIGDLDKTIQDKEPFKLVKTDPDAAKVIIADLVRSLAKVSTMLVPIIPETAAKIHSLIEVNQKPAEPLFIRKD